MSILFLLVPLALLMAGVALFAFFWSVKKGQLDDLDSPPFRAIYSDDSPISKPSAPPKDVIQK